MKQYYISLLSVAFISLGLASCDKEASRDFLNVLGCSDENASNYEETVTFDDGSCKYKADLFVGAYNATEIEITLNPTTSEYDTTYSPTFAFEISKLSNSEVVLNRLGYSCIHGAKGFTGNISGTALVVDVQNYFCIPGTVMQGDGIIDGNNFELSYKVNFGVNIKDYVIIAERSEK